jgi:hypothetical protein
MRDSRKVTARLPHATPACRAVGNCLVPTVLEGLKKPRLNFGGEVGVRLLNLVIEQMAEPTGLGDLRDLAGDHPGPVAVTQPVEGQSRLRGTQRDRGPGLVVRAVGGGAQDAASEAAAPMPLPRALRNTCAWSWLARCARNSRVSDGSRLIRRADSGVFEGPSSSPRLDSMSATTSELMLT